MRKILFHIVLASWLIAGAALTAAQVKKPVFATRKAGLWEITTTMTWQKAPFAHSTESGIGEGGSHVKQFCLTQEMIDNYGALLPQSHGECRIENKVMRPGGVTADWVCAGKITGKGVLETNWIDLEHATGKLHFLGTFLEASGATPIEWTTDSSSVFKSESCGSVRPIPLPANTRH